MNLGTVKAALHKEDVSLIALFMFAQIIHNDLTFQQALFFWVTNESGQARKWWWAKLAERELRVYLKSNLCLLLGASFSYFFPLILSARLFFPHNFDLHWSYKICFLGGRKMLQQRYKIQTKISRRFFQPWKSGKKKRSIVFKRSKCTVQAVQIQWYNPFTWTLDSFPFIAFPCVFILTLKSSPPVHRSRQNCKSHCRI